MSDEFDYLFKESPVKVATQEEKDKLNRLDRKLAEINKQHSEATNRRNKVRIKLIPPCQIEIKEAQIEKENELLKIKIEMRNLRDRVRQVHSNFRSRTTNARVKRKYQLETDEEYKEAVSEEKAFWEEYLSRKKEFENHYNFLVKKYNPLLKSKNPEAKDELQ